MLTLILMNLAVALTSALLVRYFFYFDNILDYLISFFIVFFAQIVLSLQLLGILKQLFLSNVILLNLFVLFIIYIVIRLGKIKVKNEVGAGVRSTIKNLSFTKIEILCLSAILGFGLVKIFINLINSPLGWDCLNYHFTFPVEWLKHGNLDNPISVSGDPAVSYYPINGSLFFLWFILPLKNVFIADLGQVPFFIVGFFTVYSLARKLNLPKEYALFTAAIFTLIPNYFKQLEIAYIDVICSTLLLITLNYLLLLYKNKRIVQNTILYSLPLGLLLGTKTTAMPLVLILLIPLLWFYFYRYPFKRPLFILALGILFIIVTGGFSYIRNFMQTRNPLYPLNFKLFNIVIFKGVVDNEIYRTAICPGDFSLTKVLFREGLGLQTIIFVLPAIFLGLPVRIIKNKDNLNFNLIYFMILPLLLILIFRFIIPIPNLRYIYGLFGIGSIMAFYIVDTLKLPRRLLVTLVVICILASMGELAGHLELIISLMLTFILFFALPYLIELIKAKKAVRYAIIATILFYLSLMFLEKDYIKNEYHRYVKMVDYSGFWPDATRAWEWLNQNTKDNNIAYIGRPVPFPLYGTNFKNNVYYASVNTVEPAKLHYFPNSKYIWGYIGDKVFWNFDDDNNYRGNANYEVWVNNLSGRDIDYLFIYSYLHLYEEFPAFPMEDIWAITHPDKFEPVFKNDTIHIFRFIK